MSYRQRWTKAYSNQLRRLNRNHIYKIRVKKHPFTVGETKLLDYEWRIVGPEGMVEEVGRKITPREAINEAAHRRWRRFGD